MEVLDSWNGNRAQRMRPVARVLLCVTAFTLGPLATACGQTRAGSAAPLSLSATDRAEAVNAVLMKRQWLFDAYPTALHGCTLHQLIRPDSGTSAVSLLGLEYRESVFGGPSECNVAAPWIRGNRLVVLRFREIRREVDEYIDLPGFPKPDEVFVPGASNVIVLSLVASFPGGQAEHIEEWVLAHNGSVWHVVTVRMYAFSVS